MDDWFSTIASNSELPGGAAQELHDIGFVVIPGLVASERLAQVADAYDSAVSCATPFSRRPRDSRANWDQ